MAGGFLGLRINLQGLDEVYREFGGKPKQIAKASARTVKKTTKWASNQAASELARENNIPRRAILGGNNAKARRVRSVITDDRGMVWIGYRPIKASYIGRLTQTKAGARAGNRFFERAFVATMRSGHVGIFKRLGKERLPIDEQTISLQNAVEVARRVEGEIPSRLKALLRQELNYEINVKGRQ